jgi:Ca2+-binding EF-hand superfamily protein
VLWKPAQTTAVLFALAFPAMAQTEQVMGLLDSNGDGTVTHDEFLALRATLFQRVDTDANGALTEAEVTAAAEQRQRRRSTELWSLDADNDGQLTLTEFNARTPGFDRADQNGDGVLSGAEIDRIIRLLGTLSGRDGAGLLPNP